MAETVQFARKQDQVRPTDLLTRTKADNSQHSIRNRLRKASKHSRWMHAVCDEVMLSAADTQLLLIFAFGTSFYLTSQCDVSLYHYLIAVNMILVGLTTSALSYTLARNSYKSYLSLVVRVGLFMIDYVGLTRTLDNNNFEENDRFLQRVPGNGQKDSIIVLPAFCLLDKSYDPMGDLQPSEQLHLAHTGLNRNTNFQIYAILVVGVIAFGGTILHIAYLVWEKKFRFVLWTDKFGDHTNLTAYTRDRPGLLKLLTGLWWVARFGIWAVCTIFIIWNWASIILLRRWINGSVWLELEDGANPERGVQEIGQMTPLVAAFGAIVLTFLNSLSEVLSRHTSSNGDEKTKKLTANGSYIQIQPKNHQEYTQV